MGNDTPPFDVKLTLTYTLVVIFGTMGYDLVVEEQYMVAVAAATFGTFAVLAMVSTYGREILSELGRDYEEQ